MIKTTTDKNIAKPFNDKYPRLPCRGCLKSCKNYEACGGYPWRLPQPKNGAK